MTPFLPVNALSRLLLAAGLAGGLTLACPVPARAVEMRISRDAIERTLKQQLFGGPDGRYYLKGNPQSACYSYVEDPKLSFAQDRIVVRIKTHARLGTSLRGTCLGLTLAVPAEVSLAPTPKANPSASATPALIASPTRRSSTSSSAPSSATRSPPA